MNYVCRESRLPSSACNSCDACYAHIKAFQIADMATWRCMHALHLQLLDLQAHGALQLAPLCLRQTVKNGAVPADKKLQASSMVPALAVCAVQLAKTWPGCLLIQHVCYCILCVFVGIVEVDRFSLVPGVLNQVPGFDKQVIDLVYLPSTRSCLQSARRLNLSILNPESRTERNE